MFLLFFSQERLPVNLQSWLDEPPNLPENKSCDSVSENVNVCRLDWTDFDQTQLPEADVIMGSDLVYSKELVPGLCSVIKTFLQKKKSCAAFIACTHRNGETLQYFQQVLGECGMSFSSFMKRTFAPSECFMVTHEPLRPISLYKIALK